MSDPSAPRPRMMPRLPPPPSWASELLTVGVTGTNGKTTTTALVAAALGRAGLPVPRVTTIGSFIDEEPLEVTRDLPGFLATMRAGLERGARYAAIELTSEALALGFAKTWPCRIGVFTNLTHDHLDSHRSAEHYLASKAQLFVHLPPGGTAVLNGLDPASDLLAEIVPQGVTTLRYGVAARATVLPEAVQAREQRPVDGGVPRESTPGGSPPTDGAEARAADASGGAAGHAALDMWATRVVLGWQGTRIELGARGTLGEALDRHGIGVLETQAIGHVFAENALAALAASVAAGIPADAAARALATAPRPTGRFEPVAQQPRVVLDYAHTPDALWRTLVAARQLCRGRLWVVFGAGGNRDRAKRGPMGRAARAADHVVVTNDNPRDEDPRAIAEALLEGIGTSDGVVVELDRGRAIRQAVTEADDEDVVVVAGKGHETQQEIGGVRHAFSDRDVVAAAVAARRRGGRAPA